MGANLLRCPGSFGKTPSEDWIFSPVLHGLLHVCLRQCRSHLACCRSPCIIEKAPVLGVYTKLRRSKCPDIEGIYPTPYLELTIRKPEISIWVLWTFRVSDSVNHPQILVARSGRKGCTISGHRGGWVPAVLIILMHVLLVPDPVVIFGIWGRNIGSD